MLAIPFLLLSVVSSSLAQVRALTHRAMDLVPFEDLGISN